MLCDVQQEGDGVNNGSSRKGPCCRGGLQAGSCWYRTAALGPPYKRHGGRLCERHRLEALKDPAFYVLACGSSQNHLAGLRGLRCSTVQCSTGSEVLTWPGIR